MAIRRCDCTNAFQDKKYGKNMRVHNISTKHNEYRCTVCEKAKKF
jgi:hypothetical protein